MNISWYLIGYILGYIVISLSICLTSKVLKLSDQSIKPAMVAGAILIGSQIIFNWFELVVLRINTTYSHIIIPIMVLFSACLLVWTIRGAYEISWSKSIIFAVVFLIISYIIHLVLFTIILMLGIKVSILLGHISLVTPLPDLIRTTIVGESEDVKLLNSIQTNPEGCVADNGFVCRVLERTNNSTKVEVYHPSEDIVLATASWLNTESVEGNARCDRMTKKIFTQKNSSKSDYLSSNVTILANEKFMYEVHCNDQNIDAQNKVTVGSKFFVSGQDNSKNLNVVFLTNFTNKN